MAIGVVVWHVAFLTTLPAALCCCIAMMTSSTMMSPGAGHEACHDDASAHPETSSGVATGDERCPALRGCQANTGGLLGFLETTAEPPEPMARMTPWAYVGQLRPDVAVTSSHLSAPPAPPPRA